MVTTVDEADLPIIAGHRWYAVKSACGKFYVVGHVEGRANAGENVPLHRLLLDPGPGKYVDHIDGDGLNNRRSNLRVCVPQQNSANRKISSNNTSGFKGVIFTHRSRRNPWMAVVQTRVDGKAKRICAGQYATPEMAARAYDARAREVFGEFVRPNFPAGGDA